jgi:hypothetical protein
MTTKVPAVMLDDNVNLQPIILNAVAVTATTYILYLNPIYDGMVVQIDYVLNQGTCDIQVEIDGTPVVFTTDATNPLQATTTAKSDTAASSNSFSAGDAITLVVDNLASSPEFLAVQVTLQRTS